MTHPADRATRYQRLLDLPRGRGHTDARETASFDRWPTWGYDAIWNEISSYCWRARVSSSLWLTLIGEGLLAWPTPEAPWQAAVGRLPSSSPVV